MFLRKWRFSSWITAYMTLSGVVIAGLAFMLLIGGSNNTRYAAGQKVGDGIVWSISDDTMSSVAIKLDDLVVTERAAYKECDVEVSGPSRMSIECVMTDQAFARLNNCDRFTIVLDTVSSNGTVSVNSSSLRWNRWVVSNRVKGTRDGYVYLMNRDVGNVQMNDSYNRVFIHVSLDELCAKISSDEIFFVVVLER